MDTDKQPGGGVLPRCVGVIMDGNRRWARARSLPSVEGHRRGYEKFREVAGWCKEVGVEHLVVYALSTENWKRSEQEVSYLLELMRELLRNGLREERVDSAVHLIGDLSRFPADIQEGIAAFHAENPAAPARHLWVCVSYGGRAEILAAVAARTQGGEVTEASIAEHLWTAGMPDPDLVFRTGGEQRLSNFLLWQVAYSELFFSPTLWPDLSRSEFDELLRAYGMRKRNYGV